MRHPSAAAPAPQAGQCRRRWSKWSAHHDAMTKGIMMSRCKPIGSRSQLSPLPDSWVELFFPHEVSLKISMARLGQLGVGWPRLVPNRIGHSFFFSSQWFLWGWGYRLGGLSSNFVFMCPSHDHLRLLRNEFHLSSNEQVLEEKRNRVAAGDKRRKIWVWDGRCDCPVRTSDGRLRIYSDSTRSAR